MKVNHLHLMVPDVPAASAFFEKYFELRKAKVDAIHGRMTADAIDVASPQRTHAYSFYVKAPGDFLVEVGA